MAKLIPAPAGYFLVKAYEGSEGGRAAFTCETPIVGYRVERDGDAVPVTLSDPPELLVPIAWAVRVPDGRLFWCGGKGISGRYESADCFENYASSKDFLAAAVRKKHEIPF